VSSAIGITCPEDLFELDASVLSCPPVVAQAASVLSCPPVVAQAAADQTGPSGNITPSVVDAGCDEQGETPGGMADGVRKAQPVANIALTSAAPNSTAEQAPDLIVESNVVSPVVIRHEPAVQSSTPSRHIIIAKCKSLRRAIRYNISQSEISGKPTC
jgi:hypothetical protein